MMSTTTEWKICFRNKITTAHNNWLEAEGKGVGRIDLEEKNLTRANLHGENFTKARFVRCDWSNSNISGVFAEAEITECIWKNSLLYSIRFNRASIENCNFVDAYLGLCKFIEAKVKGGNWSRCDLDKSTWTDAVVENACFQRVNFKEARFHGSRFVNCDIRNANLKSATLRGAVFENCDFRGSYLYDFVFEEVTFINCGFYGCTGVPAFEGEYTFIEPDLSPTFDGTGVVEPEQLFEQWKSKAPLSLRKTANYPQWLDYLSRENMIKQVRWVSGGMKGSPSMDLISKDLSHVIAYRAYFRAARFTECDFTASDLRRTTVQQAEFISCKFDNALLMYLEGRQETSLDVETTKVLFKDCIAHGTYFNRSELWQPEFFGGNWDGSFFNNCIWTCAELKDVSFENTDWRGAVLNTVKFINCSFKNAKFHEAELRAIQFINCDFKDADFGHVKGSIVKMIECGFSGTKGMLFDIEPLKDGEIRVVDADLSPDYDGSLVFESFKTTQDLFFRIRDISSNEDNQPEESQIMEEKEPKQPEMSEKQKLSQSKQQLTENKKHSNTEDNLEQSTGTDEPKQTEINESKSLPQLQQELDNDKQQLKKLRSQLQKVEQQIENARRTNIFGRPQSGLDEAERDRLIQSIAEIQEKIAQNESLKEAD